MSYPVEKLPEGWITADIGFRHRNGREDYRYEIVDMKTGACYLHEPMRITACKCFALFLVGLPLYFLIYTAHQLVRTVVFPCQIWTLARIPLYFIKLEFAALYGIFRPLSGRVLFAKVESEFHGGKKRYESIQYQKDVHLPKTCYKSLIDPNYPHAFFAGVCMQPIGKTNDPHIISIREVLPAV